MMISARKKIVRNHPYLKHISIIIAVLGLLGHVEAQISQGGRPYSFSNSIADSMVTSTMDAINVDALLAEDVAEKSQDSPPPPRFGYAFSVSLGLDSVGIWTDLPNGDRVWRHRLDAPGAYSINLLYDEFWLPAGSMFFIYNEDRSMVLGAFTSANNKEHGKFSTGPVKGPISILEYYEPAHVRGTGLLNISRVVHAYKDFFGDPKSSALGKVAGTQDFGDSDTCNNNVNCPEGALWAEGKQAVVMILTSGGTRLCSGAMVNNVNEDFKNYLLTANHCLGNESTWIIMFNYESAGCTNTDGPTNLTVSGTTVRASSSEADFALVELSSVLPDSYHVFYAGWHQMNTGTPSVLRTQINRKSNEI